MLRDEGPEATDNRVSSYGLVIVWLFGFKYTNTFVNNRKNISLKENYLQMARLKLVWRDTITLELSNILISSKQEKTNFVEKSVNKINNFRYYLEVFTLFWLSEVPHWRRDMTQLSLCRDKLNFPGCLYWSIYRNPNVQTELVNRTVNYCLLLSVVSHTVTV